MRKYILPLLLVMLVAVSCKNIDLNGALDSEYLDVRVTYVGSTYAELNIQYPSDFTPDPSQLKIINRKNDRSMSFSMSNLSSVKLTGLNPSSTYTFYVILPKKKSDSYYNDYSYVLISRKDITVKTTAK